MAERSVVIRLKGDIGDFSSKMRAAKASVGDTVAEMGKASKRGAELRRSFGTVADAGGKIGLAAAGGLALATKAAMDWESAFAGVRKTVNETATMGYAELEDDLRGLARTLPATHAEIAGVAEAAGQLGIAADDVTGFTRVMIDLGETTNLTAEEAATSIARFSNVMQLSASDVDRVGSALVELGNNSETTEAEILAIGQRMAAAGQIAGLSASDVLAFGATLTSVGVEAEAGGTALSKVFTSVRDAALDGGRKLEVFAETAGVSTEEFTRAFQEDAAGAVEMFIAGLNRLNESGQSTTPVFNELKLNNERLKAALLSTAAAQDHLSDRLEMGEDAWSANEALAIEAAARYETSAAQMQVAVNNIKDAMIDFGEVALPILAGAADKVAGFAQAVGSLPGPVKTAGTSLLGITAVLGGGLWFTSKTINAVAGMNEALSTLGIKAPKAAGALGKLSKAAGAAGVALAGMAIADSIQKMDSETLPGLEAVTKQLIELKNTGAGESLSAEFESLADSVDLLSNLNAAQKFQESIADVIGFGGLDAISEAEAEIEALDGALTHLVGTGNADVAADALENLAKAQGLSAGEMEQLRSLLPGYSDALAGLDNDAALAADGMGEIAGAAEEGAEQVDGFTEALEGFNDAIDQRGDRRAYRDALRSFNEAMKEAPENMRRGSAAWDEVEAELDGIADAALAVAEDLEGVGRRKYLAKVRKEFIDAATDMGIPKKAAQDLATELGLLDKKDPRIDVWMDTTDALSDLSLLKERIDWVTQPRSARISVAVAYSDAGFTPKGGPQEGNWATGGFTGPGGKYDPAGIVHRGEYVFSAEATAGNVAELDQLHRRLRGYSDGGPVAASRPAPLAASTSAGGASGPQEIRGTLHIPGLGDGFIRGVVQSETSSDRNFERAMAGRGY